MPPYPTDLISILMTILATWLVWETTAHPLRRVPDWIQTVLVTLAAILMLTAPWPLLRYGLGIAAAVALIRILLARLT
nr:MAG: hypothetical protein DIU80_23955 [Chloroflexota bacterium]